MMLARRVRSIGHTAVVVILFVAPVASGCAGSKPVLAPVDAHNENSQGREAACSVDDPPTAGNLVSSFLGDVQQGRDPTIQGGVDDPFGCAYAQLCSEIRGRISEADFRDSRAEAVSSMLSADTWAGARTGPYEYTPGVDVERPDMETLDSDVVSTWEDVESTWYEHIDDRTIVSDSGQTERWRVSLVREHGDWRVCGFDKRET